MKTISLTNHREDEFSSDLHTLADVVGSGVVVNHNLVKEDNGKVYGTMEIEYSATEDEIEQLKTVR